MRYININDAKQTFILEEDIFDKNGLLLVSKGSALTEDIIQKIKTADFNIVAVSEASGSEEAVSKEEAPQESEAMSADDKSFMVNILKVTVTNIKLLGKDYFSPVKPLALECVNEIAQYEEAVSLLYKLSKIDAYTINHSIRVGLLSALISHWEESPKERIKKSFLAGLFSQVGKLGVPKSLILKTDPLSEDELKVIKSYTLYSDEFLKDLPFIDDEISAAILQSTEKLNGSGYPMGLRGTQISYLAQIVGVSNIFDAAINNKSYRSAISPFKIAAELFDDSIEQLSPKATIPLVKAIQSCFIGMKVELSNGETGEVVYMNKIDPTRPMVKVNDTIYDLSMGKEKLSITRMLP